MATWSWQGDVEVNKQNIRTCPRLPIAEGTASRPAHPPLQHSQHHAYNAPVTASRRTGVFPHSTGDSGGSVDINHTASVAANGNMGFPATYCSICGGPFGNPYSDIVSESPDSKLLEGCVEDDFDWLSSACLFGVASSLETFGDAEQLAQCETPASKTLSKSPAFFGNARSVYGSDENTFRMNGRSYSTHVPNSNGDILFAMHEGCAVIIQRVFEARGDSLVALGSLATIRNFYDKLRKECPNARRLDEFGNIWWPHDYYGAIEYWSYDDWEYEAGCSKYLFDPLYDKSLTTFALELLQPAKKQPRSKIVTSEWASSAHANLESLPTEIIDRVVSFMPAPSAFALRIVSTRLNQKIPLNQRFFREQLIEGKLVPYVWDLDVQACRNIERHKSEKEGLDEYWDWRQLARHLNDTKSIVERDPDNIDGPIPGGFWNRCRLWLTVTETELW